MMAGSTPMNEEPAMGDPLAVFKCRRCRDSGLVVLSRPNKPNPKNFDDWDESARPCPACRPGDENQPGQWS